MLHLIDKSIGKDAGNAPAGLHLIIRFILQRSNGQRLRVSGRGQRECEAPEREWARLGRKSKAEEQDMTKQTHFTGIPLSTEGFTSTGRERVDESVAKAVASKHTSEETGRQKRSRPPDQA